MIMDTKTIVAMWDMAQSRFHNMVSGLPEDALSLAIGPATIGYMLRHSAEVEYVYAEWVFGKSKPEELTYYTLRGPAHAKVEFLNLQEHIDLLKASHATVKDAILSMSGEEWSKEVKTPRGIFTPLDAIVQLIYHTGIHAGQISLIQKYA